MNQRRIVFAALAITFLSISFLNAQEGKLIAGTLKEGKATAKSQGMPLIILGLTDT